MDGTANDLPPGFEIKGYPTIFFVPGTAKHEPVLYDGDRSYKDVKVCLLSSFFALLITFMSNLWIFLCFLPLEIHKFQIINIFDGGGTSRAEQS